MICCIKKKNTSKQKQTDDFSEKDLPGVEEGVGWRDCNFPWEAELSFTALSWDLGIREIAQSVYCTMEVAQHVYCQSPGITWA